MAIILNTTLINKEDMTNPNSPIATAVRIMRENMEEAQSLMRETFAIYNEMYDHLVDPEKPITYGEVEELYCNKMEEKAARIRELLL